MHIQSSPFLAFVSCLSISEAHREHTAWWVNISAAPPGAIFPQDRRKWSKHIVVIYNKDNSHTYIRSTLFLFGMHKQILSDVPKREVVSSSVVWNVADYIKSAEAINIIDGIQWVPFQFPRKFAVVDDLYLCLYFCYSETKMQFPPLESPNILPQTALLQWEFEKIPQAVIGKITWR